MPLPHSKTTNINSLKAHSMTQFRRTSKVVVVISKGQKKKSILGLEDRQRRGRNRKSLKPPSQVKLCGGGGTSALAWFQGIVISTPLCGRPALSRIQERTLAFIGAVASSWVRSIICCVRQVDFRTNQSACRPCRTWGESACVHLSPRKLGPMDQCQYTRGACSVGG